MSSQITEASTIKAYVLAGKATFTLVSKMTGKRFTFKVVQKVSSEDGFFVRLLVGNCNETDYAGIGFLNVSRNKFYGSKVVRHPTATAAFQWFVGNLLNDKVSDKVEFWHSGQCGRCGRKLTVPSSIATGLGPECAGKLGFVAEAA